MSLFVPFRFNYRDVRKDSEFSELTTAEFHKSTHLLVVAFSDGTFYLHEMPDFNMIQSLRSFSKYTRRAFTYFLQWKNWSSVSS